MINNAQKKGFKQKNIVVLVGVTESQTQDRNPAYQERTKMPN
jgi:hypothetical protein